MRLEGKRRFASMVSTLPCLLAMAALAPLNGVHAQDNTAPEPAPVLRGFRLDPEPAKATPPPPTPTTTPQSETPKASSTASSKPPAQTRPSQQPRTKAAEPPASPPSSPEPASSSSQDTEEQSTVTTPEAPAATQAAPETGTIEPISSGSDNSLWFKFAAALAALGVVIAGIWWLRRQAPSRTADDEIVSQPAAPVPAPAPPAKPTPVPTRSIVIPPVQKPPAEAPVLLEFIPDRAVISINNLSVSGKLRLTNRSDKPVEHLRLRAALFGASADQAEIISAFHNRDDGSEKPLADLKPGEKRAFAIDMALPLADMPSYVVGSQKLLVPIVVANLAYGNGRNAPVELACVVGREANPPQPKLGPLRLDLGPRSFAPLGQRQLAA